MKNFAIILVILLGLSIFLHAINSPDEDVIDPYEGFEIDEDVSVLSDDVGDVGDVGDVEYLQNYPIPVREINMDIEFPHWDHMPLFYRISDNCSERQKNLSRAGFHQIWSETGKIVSFLEVNSSEDIYIECLRDSLFGGEGEDAIATAQHFMKQENKGLFERGIITIYGQGRVCGKGYPALEVHELLHLFGIGHSPFVNSVMSPYAAESTRKCGVEFIDPEYISCLRYIYSDGLIEGSCDFPNYIHEENNYETVCPEDYYESIDGAWCCPAPGMRVEGEYCVY